MARTYVFREAPVAIINAKNADPQVIGEALEKIAAANNNHLDIEAVVEAAKNRRHALHKHFQWDTQKAAHAHWLDTARAIVRCVRVVDDEERPQIAWVSVSEKGGRSYRNREDVLNSADLQMSVLRAAERDLAAWETRYRELADLCADIKAVRERIAQRMMGKEDRPSI